MSEQPPAPKAEMKKCQYCGRMTSATASFCWWCTRELAARPERPESKSSPSIRIPVWGWIALGVVLVAVVLAFVLW